MNFLFFSFTCHQIYRIWKIFYSFSEKRENFKFLFKYVVYEQNLQAWIDHEFDMCALLMAVVTAWYMQKSSMHGRAQCSTMGPSLYEVAIAFIITYFTRFSQMLNTCSPGLKLWKNIPSIQKCKCDLKDFSPIVNKCSGRCVLSDLKKNDAYQ